VALYMVRCVAQAVRIPVVGIGGIRSGSDAVEFLLCGARAVQVGTATFYDPAAPVRIVDELTSYLIRHGIGDVTELVGALEA
jgi:dihydroorotate dehydrogenase (NAD+) catalytic subunit